MGKRTKRQLAKVTKRQPNVHATSKRGDLADVEVDEEDEDIALLLQEAEREANQKRVVAPAGLPMSADIDESDNTELISDELREELGDHPDLILPSKKQKTKPAAVALLSQEEEKVALKMNKKLKRKLDHLKQKKQKESARSELHESLAKHALNPDHLSLMVKTSLVGQELSLKQRLANSLNRQRAGLDVSEEGLDELTRKKKQGGGSDLDFFAMNSSNSKPTETVGQVLGLNEHGLFTAMELQPSNEERVAQASKKPPQSKYQIGEEELDERRKIKLERQATKRAEKKAKKQAEKEEMKQREQARVSKDIGSIGAENRKARLANSQGEKKVANSGGVGWAPAVKSDSDDSDDSSENEEEKVENNTIDDQNENDKNEIEEDEENEEDDENDDEEEKEEEEGGNPKQEVMSVAARMMASLSKLKQGGVISTQVTTTNKLAKLAKKRSRQAKRVSSKGEADEEDDDDDDDDDEEEDDDDDDDEQGDDDDENKIDVEIEKDGHDLKNGGNSDDSDEEREEKDKTNMVKWSETLPEGQQAYIPQPVYEPFGGPLGGTKLNFKPAKETQSSSTKQAAAAASITDSLSSMKPAVSLSDRVAQGNKYEGDGKMGLVRTFVNRPQELQARRMMLPVNGMEQEIVEAIVTGSPGCMQDVVVLCGETGSGKSTQVPQFLFEYGFGGPGVGLIGVTQPRRVAAVSTAQRVAHELQTEFGDKVGVQIRGDSSNLSANTRIKFMTDGILLQEIKNDFLLRKYSVIILDEAHERNLNTDVLIGLLSRALPLRNKLAREQAAKRSEGKRGPTVANKPCSKKSKSNKKSDASSENEEMDEQEEEVRGFEGGPLRPLKLIIMSATLRVDDFVQNKALFPTPPALLRVQSRQYPVTIHFNKKTSNKFEYMDECFNKVCKIHTKLPPGSILVFLTGKREILAMCKRIRKRFQVKKVSSEQEEGGEEGGMNKEERGRGSSEGQSEKEDDDDVRDMDMDEEEFDKAEDDDEINEEEEDEDDGSEEGDSDVEVGDFTGGPVEVHPLYAMLSNQDQSSVFSKPKNPNARMIIVATNVAETSITIPGVAYVVDCGRAKQRVLDHRTGISSFEIDWISRSSADQRAGRAGRTGPGHCYRLYSSNVYASIFKSFHMPEVRTRSLEDVVLQMKSMNIANVHSFPFPSAPDAVALRSAHLLLLHLGALTLKPQNEGKEGAEDTLSLADSHQSESEITELGQAIATLPLNARFAKMVLLGRQCKMLGHVIALVAALSENDPFVREQTTPQEVEEAKTKSEQSSVKFAAKQKRIEAAERLQRLSKHPNSDALARLKAFGAYVHVEGSGSEVKRRAFCSEYSLHEPTLSRVHQIEKQLRRVLKTRFPTDVLSNTLAPPTEVEETKLRQILLSAFLDHVGRLCPPGTVTSGSMLDRNCAYLASTNALAGEALYLSPASCLFDASAAIGESFTEAQKKIPKWVVFDSVIRATGNDKNGGVGRAFMTCVTEIDPTWIPQHAKSAPPPTSNKHSILPTNQRSRASQLRRDASKVVRNTQQPHLLLRLSKPSDTQSAFYDLAQDCVKCFVVPSFGVLSWQLKAVAIPMRDSKSSEEEEVRQFAKLLLEGKVVKEWAEIITPLLNDPPALITTQVKGMPSKKVTMLLLALKATTIDSTPSSSKKRKSSAAPVETSSPQPAVVSVQTLVKRLRLKASSDILREALALWLRGSTTKEKEKQVDRAFSCIG